MNLLITTVIFAVLTGTIYQDAQNKAQKRNFTLNTNLHNISISLDNLRKMQEQHKTGLRRHLTRKLNYASDMSVEEYNDFKEIYEYEKHKSDELTERIENIDVEKPLSKYDEKLINESQEQLDRTIDSYNKMKEKKEIIDLLIDNVNYWNVI